MGKSGNKIEKEGPSVLSLTQGLLVSGGLNLLLLFLFVAMMVKETPPLAFASFRDASNISARGPLRPATLSFLDLLSTKSFEEVGSYLSSEEPIEDGLTKRDLALSWLVAAHHFDLRRALFGLSKPISDRIVRVKVQDQMWELRLFPRLPEKHLDAIKHFIEKEKWPLDADGLYEKLKLGMRDPSLVESFLWTKEYLLIERLLKEAGVDAKPHDIVTRLLNNQWTLEMWRFPQVEKLYLLFETQKPVPVVSQAPKSSKTYTVQEGDSLWKIAKKEGVTVDALRAKNPTLASILKPGMKIELPLSSKG
jgi:LysM repeat protein